MIEVGTLAEVLGKQFNIKVEQFNSAPTWKFEPEAVDEIIDFFSSCQDGSTKFGAPEEILVSVKVPKLTKVEFKNKLGNEFRAIVVDSRNTGIFPDKDPWAISAIVEHDRNYSDRDQRMITTISVHCVVARCFFKERFVERLTKHQERILRRYGQLGVDSPRIINVAWDAPTPKLIYERHVREEAERAAARRCLHEVGGHPRHLRSGKTVWVRGHQRGDPNIERKTIINHTRSKRHEP